MAVEAFNENKLTIGSLTGGEREGRGVFDELMRATKDQLDNEYKYKRITGEEYTKAYIAIMQSAMSQGSAYILQYLITNQNVKLLDQQILESEKRVALVQAQIDDQLTQTRLTEEQITLAQKSQLQADQDLINSKKQEALLDEQVTGATKDNIIKDNQAAQTLEQTKLIIQQTANAVTENIVLVNQAAKIIAETSILGQKLKTEQAQIVDQVDGLPVAGIIGKQKELYTNQADGYIRDAEQKVAKMFSDMMATRVSVDETTYDLTTAQMQNDDVAAVMTKLRQGIGI